MKIVVGIDGSEIAETALEAIVPLARAAQAKVLLVAIRQKGVVHETWTRLSAGGDRHASTIPTPAMVGAGHPPMLAVEDRGQAMERARVETEEALSDLAAQHLAGITYETCVEWSDDVPGAIIRVAEHEHAQLIALGTHGRTGFRNNLLGGVAQAVLRGTAIPVLFARKHNAH